MGSFKRFWWHGLRQEFELKFERSPMTSTLHGLEAIRMQVFGRQLDIFYQNCRMREYEIPTSEPFKKNKIPVIIVSCFTGESKPRD